MIDRPDAQPADAPTSSPPDRARVDALIQQHLAQLLAYVRARSGPLVRAKESLSDLVQSTCREVLEHANVFQVGDEDGFRAWLFTTAERKVRDKVRYWKAERRDIGREAQLQETLNYYSRFSSPSHGLSVEEQLQSIERALDSLPDDYREVIGLHHIMGLKHADIARHLNRSEVAVRQLLSRARARLAIALGAAK
ncbi:MAG: RNA polymerase sigma factor [Planctomycetota bacterium]